MFKIVVLCGPLLAAGCSNGSDAISKVQTPFAIPVAANTLNGGVPSSGANIRLASTATSLEVRAARDHNYDFREGDAYGYVAAVSDDDQRNGKTAGDVLIYRYAGFSNGMYELELLGTSGAVIGMAECRSPCTSIRVQFVDGAAGDVPDLEESVLHAAFEDALGGKLVRARTAVAAEAAYRP